MKTSKQASVSSEEASREALEHSEKKAFEREPKEFNDEAAERKIVEVGPVLTRDPIKGIDPVK